MKRNPLAAIPQTPAHDQSIGDCEWVFAPALRRIEGVSRPEVLHVTRCHGASSLGRDVSGDVEIGSEHTQASGCSLELEFDFRSTGDVETASKAPVRPAGPNLSQGRVRRWAEETIGAKPSTSTLLSVEGGAVLPQHLTRCPDSDQDPQRGRFERLGSAFDHGARFPELNF